MSKYRLYVDALNLQPVDYDFSEGYGEKWELVMPDIDDWSLRRCSAYLEDEGYTGDAPGVNPFDMGREEMAELIEEHAEKEVGPFHSDEDLREKLIRLIDDGTVEGIDEWRELVRSVMYDDQDSLSPMMNYYYPLPHLRLTPGEAQEKVMGTSCVVVLVDGEPVLALAGGGMDLSPDICRAYVNLGYYPPMHFAEGLPRLGTAYREITPELLDACLEGARIALGWAQSTVERLEKFAEEVSAARTA